MRGQTEHQNGIIYAASAYILWGFLPLYWKLLGDLGAEEIMANRILWSFLFMLVLLLMSKKWTLLLKTLRGFAKNKRQLAALCVASVLITINWFVYIWGVNTEQMVETSLGYYINPLISVLLGVIFFKEKLSHAQIISFSLASIGVIIMTLSYGSFPWLALTLALTFGLYGMAKKLIKMDSAVGLALETMVVTPIAVLYMWLVIGPGNHLFIGGGSTTFLLIGAGAATAIPLLFFAKGAQRIPLSMLGFLQYIAPTIMLILGIFVYHETFSKSDLLAFVFIWSALTIYSISKTKLVSNLEMKARKEKSTHI